MKIRPDPSRAPTRDHSDLYDEYISSPAWRETRAAALARAGARCQAPGCTETAGLEVHHRHYRTLTGETPADLVVLCPACHRNADRRRVETMKLTRRLRQVRDDVRGGR